jgi:hypothetical protein
LLATLVGLLSFFGGATTINTASSTFLSVALYVALALLVAIFAFEACAIAAACFFVVVFARDAVVEGGGAEGGGAKGGGAEGGGAKGGACIKSFTEVSGDIEYGG